MLLTSAGVEPATSWSPVGRCIQLSHRGRLVLVVDTLFSDTQSKENEPEPLANDDFTWRLPKFKIHKKGEAVSASLINTACTSQCEVDEIISKYKIPSHCDKIGHTLSIQKFGMTLLTRALPSGALYTRGK